CGKTREHVSRHREATSRSDAPILGRMPRLTRRRKGSVGVLVRLVATALLQGVEPGDHIVAPIDVYFGLRQVIDGVFAKWPLETAYVDMTNLRAVQAVMRPNTRLVLIETPSNPRLQITDLEAVARMARVVNAITVCDGTFTTAVLQRPLDCGIDMV